MTKHVMKFYFSFADSPPLPCCGVTVGEDEATMLCYVRDCRGDLRLSCCFTIINDYIVPSEMSSALLTHPLPVCQ